MDDERTTNPPPPPHDDWQQELKSSIAGMRDETGRLLRLTGELAACAHSFGTHVIRLCNAASRIPKDD